MNMPTVALMALEFTSMRFVRHKEEQIQCDVQTIMDRDIMIVVFNLIMTLVL
jgi:hypothetical protein